MSTGITESQNSQRAGYIRPRDWWAVSRGDTEVLQVASLRISLARSAHRKIFVVPFQSLANIILEDPENFEIGTLLTKHATNFLKNASAFPDALAKLRKVMYEVRHIPNSAVYLPMGVFCAEEVTPPTTEKGMVEAVGIRRSFALQHVGSDTYEGFGHLGRIAVDGNLDEGKVGSFMKIVHERLKKRD